MKEKIPINHEYLKFCKKCGGKCCKNSPCYVFPEEFKEITTDILIKKIKEGFCFDYWEGNPTNNEKYDNLTFYYLRPQCKGHSNKIVHGGWGGECIFLKKTGCSFSEKYRPLGGKALIPGEKCKTTIGYTKQDCSIDWISYNNIIIKAIKKLIDQKKINRIKKGDE